MEEINLSLSYFRVAGWAKVFFLFLGQGEKIKREKIKAGCREALPN